MKSLVKVVTAAVRFHVSTSRATAEMMIEASPAVASVVREFAEEFAQSEAVTLIAKMNVEAIQLGERITESLNSAKEQIDAAAELMKKAVQDATVAELEKAQKAA